MNIRPLEEALQRDPPARTTFLAPLVSDYVRAATPALRQHQRRLLRTRLETLDEGGWRLGVTEVRRALEALRDEPTWQRHVQAALAVLSTERRVAAALVWFDAVARLHDQLEERASTTDALCLV